MKRFVRLLTTGTVAVAVAAGGTMIAHADWFEPKRPVRLVVHAVKMPKGVKPSVAKQGVRAVVSWSAQEIAPDVLMDHYIVTAHSAANPPLADVVHTVAASGGSTESVTFAAGEVAGSRWYWTIIPKFRLWVGAESGKSQRLTFPAAPAAGSAAPPVDPATEVAAPAPTASTPNGAGSAVTESPEPTETETATPPAPVKGSPNDSPDTDDLAPPALSSTPPAPPVTGTVVDDNPPE